MKNATQNQFQQNFSACYKNYVNLVNHSLRSFSISQQEKEEIVQEVFTRFYLHLEDINPAKAKSWLVITAQNLAKDSFNKHRRSKTDICQDTALSAEVSLWEKTDGLCEKQASTLEKLEKITSNNSLKTIQAFYFQDKPVKVIAAERKHSVSSVTSALSRERKALLLQLRKAS